MDRRKLPMSSTAGPLLSVVMPAYNEEGSIEVVVNEWTKMLNKVEPDDVIEAMRKDALIGDSEIVSRWHHAERYGYPTPFLGRDAALDAINLGLESVRVFSRGRFGAWKYEVSNQDHSFMQGVELVDRLLSGGEEFTLRRPDHANSGVFLRSPAAK